MQMPEQEYVMALDYSVPLIRDHRADLYVFPNEPHQKFQPRHKLAAYERNIDWFRFWLQGYEDSDPAKHEQYKHWRAMKAAGVERSPCGCRFPARLAPQQRLALFESSVRRRGEAMGRASCRERGW